MLIVTQVGVDCYTGWCGLLHRLVWIVTQVGVDVTQVGVDCYIGWCGLLHRLRLIFTHDVVDCHTGWG